MEAQRACTVERARRRKTSAQIAAQTARKRYRRQGKAAERAAAAPSVALPWYETLNGNRQRPVEAFSTVWARACSKCSSQLLDQEKDGWCCNQGRWQLDPLEPYPAAFADFLDQNAQALQEHARTLNNLFAFSAIGYTGRQLRFSGPQNVVITGRVYHRMLDLDADQGSLH
jgi:hypothetical protein